MCGNQPVPSADAEVVLSLPSISSATRLIGRCYVLKAADQHHHLFCVADVGNGEEAFHVGLVDTQDAQALPLGELVEKLLTIGALSRNRSVRTIGDTTQLILPDLDEVQAKLSSLGIDKVDITASFNCPTEEYKRVLTTFATENAKIPRKILRP